MSLTYCVEHDRSRPCEACDLHSDLTAERDAIRAELDQANTRCQLYEAELYGNHAEIDRLRAEVALLRRVNHRDLCGCEESAGVFGCGLNCPCACHPLRARCARLEAELKALYATGEELEAMGFDEVRATLADAKEETP